MMEDSHYESFEPLDLPYVSTHASVTRNFPQFPKVYSREKVIQNKSRPRIQLNPGNEITVRSDPPLHTQPGETSIDSTNNLDLDLPLLSEKAPKNALTDHSIHYHTMCLLSTYHHPQEFHCEFKHHYHPNTVSEALTKREWKDAIREEMSALEKNKTWEIVERPKGKNIVDCNCKNEYCKNPTITSCPLQLELLQYDVKNAFLHGDLDEEIYMNIPSGFEGNTAKVTTLSSLSTRLQGSNALLVYVDDIIVTGNDEREKHEVKQRLATKTGRLGVNQSLPQWIQTTSWEKLKRTSGDKRMYQRLVGRLIYLAHTRPDIAYSKNNTLALEAYTDADYASSLVDRRSTTGYCTFLGGNLVTWRSKKQNVVARSSAESEFRAIAQGLCELLWLKIILDDLRIKWDGPMKLYCDNKSLSILLITLYNTIGQNILRLIDISSKKNWRKQ
ncbi:Retrovirus-related Pol polyprotein from transposon RE1 [Vitis vinifera]|uniref:Retrovirus-related Pol polyprotein from transposon RE1 n=1 Tax=Vitis vinifera TaxID=29760 RepID=A0A438JGN6_VITVI|nr:Retrovirus-related Pol polyprotein from transposon RE1 [Vitis vinifera]